MSDAGKYFVSYARADWELVSLFVQELRNDGADLWLDQVDLKPGDAWDRSVETALRAAKGVLLFMSPAAAASDNVMDEIGVAIAEAKSIVIVLIEPCTIPMRLARLQYIDFTANPVTAYRQCVAQLIPDLAPVLKPEPLVLDPDQTQAIKALLVSHMGPVAITLVDRALVTAATKDAFLEALAAPLSDTAERVGFLIKARQTLGMQAPPEGARKPAREQISDIEDIRAALIPFIGPIADHLVQSYSAKAHNRSDLLDALAGHIKDLDQKALFLDQLKTPA